MHDFKNKNENKLKVSKKYFDLSYNNIISIENLLEAWNIFKKGKRNKLDVKEFEFNLMSNILEGILLVYLKILCKVFNLGYPWQFNFATTRKYIYE